MIFSRGSRTAGKHARHRSDRSRPAGDQRRSLAEELALPESPQPDQPPQAAEPTAAPPGGTAEPAGPFDISEAPQQGARLDLGSMQIPSVTGVQVRVQANKDGNVSRVVLVHGSSALQLAAFAAPRSEPIWDEVREEIRKSLFDEGVAVEEAAGSYGVELRAKVRTQEGLKDLRFAGVDGPRWLVRADFQGPVALDPAQSPKLLACLHGLVVDRGDEARPAKEALPLRLSERMAAQVQQQAAAAPPGGPGPASSTSGPVRAVDAVPSGLPSVTAGGALGGASAGETAGGAPAARRRKPSPRPRPRDDDAGSGAGTGGR